MRARFAALVLVPLVLTRVDGLEGQHPIHDLESEPEQLALHWGAQAIGLVTHAAPAVLGRNLTEGYLTQPALKGGLAYRERLHLETTLVFEGLTLRRGELNAGTWGEGYVDRRHPHTYLHEIVATTSLVGGAASPRHLTVTFGKGFVPFGTDDPMVRPFVKYPSNHHLAQILERLVATAAYREGPVVFEGAIFNGDEPAGPGDFANVSRFADSWAARVTALLAHGIEASVSYADVESPEFPAGSGLDHRKWSAALRLERHTTAGETRYALVEWARTDEYSGDRRSFRFHSTLAEAAADRGPTRIALRVERTVRPEEERLLDPFRSPRPHGDANILGSTRWWIGSGRAERRFAGWESLAATPFVEVSRLHARAVLRPTVFEPAEFYGSDWMWSFSVGLRLDAGTRHSRMGRYGAARVVGGEKSDLGPHSVAPATERRVSHHSSQDR